MDSIKEAFHRLRPSPIHSSFSFPSGHTTGATFIVATLLFVLIPVFLHTLQRESSSSREEPSETSETVTVFKAISKVGLPSRSGPESAGVYC